MTDIQVRRRALIKPVSIDLPGKLFVPQEEWEADCRVIQLSTTEASIRCERKYEHETSVVLYVEGFGRFDGIQG